MSFPVLRFGLKPSPEPVVGDDRPLIERSRYDVDDPLTPPPPLRDDDDPALSSEVSGAEITQQMMRLYFPFFANEVLTGPPEFPYEGRFMVNRHHEDWGDIILRGDRMRKEDETARKAGRNVSLRSNLCCIESARDHGKSWFWTIGYPIWEAWRRKSIIITIFSETHPQANDQLSKLKREIEDNPRLKHLKDPSCWAADHIRLTTGSQIYARGFGVKSRGMHPHIVICDDVVSEAAAYSELTRQRQADYFLANVRNQVVPGGAIVVIGTPQSEDDLYGLLERNEEWFFKRYPAIDDKGTFLWPDRYDAELLSRRKKEIGALRFSREFLCKAVASGSSLFPDDLVNGEPFFQLTCTLGPRLQSGNPARPWWAAHGVTRFFLGVDIARSNNVESDYFVIFVIGLDSMGNRWVTDIFREKGLSYKAQKAAIADKARTWGIELGFIESNIAQSIYGDELIEETDLPIRKYQTGSEKHDLERGIPSIRVLFENRKYRCPRGDEDSIHATDAWIAEMQGWTFANGKIVSVSRHDDIAMAQWLCERAIEEADRFQFALGAQKDDKEIAEQVVAEEAAMLQHLGPNVDPFIMMGIDPRDLVRKRGETGNLDFGGLPGEDPLMPRLSQGSTHGGVISRGEAPPRHPHGVPDFDRLTRGGK